MKTTRRSKHCPPLRRSSVHVFVTMTLAFLSLASGAFGAATTTKIDFVEFLDFASDVSRSLNTISIYIKALTLSEP